MDTKHQTTGLENTTFNILIALGKEAQFLYSTVDTYKSCRKRKQIGSCRYVEHDKARSD
jgi:hypothetical protein